MYDPLCKSLIHRTFFTEWENNFLSPSVWYPLNNEKEVVTTSYLERHYKI